MSDALHERLRGKTVVASISGGKDSAAMSLWLHEQGIEHLRCFLGTGCETLDSTEDKKCKGCNGECGDQCRCVENP